MPSEIRDLQGLPSSSFFSESACFPNERQVGFWKSDNMLDNDGWYHLSGKYCFAFYDFGAAVFACNLEA
ncbi:hypothetical protein TIFTF001_018534 [Ficus carica]|uniref:Uncharacterized protein n=1 Tax=Ficus carica TaxID=3494 RepID=A0AA88AVM2_FICCA|nr:hypothetical protein TIFTF001_018534 [Ficus carica]